MKYVILDTNFIISCVKQKIDFFEKISHEGMQALIPLQAIRELEGLKADAALKIIEKNDFKTLDVQGEDADEAIIKIAKKDPSLIIATLDRDLQKQIKNKKMIIRGKKKLEII